MNSRIDAMTDRIGSFAIIPCDKPPAGAIAYGPLDVIMEPVLDSKARAEPEALVARADARAEQEREHEQREQELFADGIRAIAAGIDFHAELKITGPEA
jgi:hypothetical protein